MNKKPDYAQLYEIAENQGGYFSASQAREIGFSWERLSENTSTGRFSRAAHGVYRLTQFPYSRYEDLFIACLRAGPKSIVSHESALSVYDLSDVIPHEIHLIVPRSSSARRKGIRQHTNKLAIDEITNREGLKITTVERTIADVIVWGISNQHARQAIQEALQRGLTTRRKLREYSARRKGKAEKVISDILKLQD